MLIIGARHLDLRFQILSIIEQGQCGLDVGESASIPLDQLVERSILELAGCVL